MFSFKPKKKKKKRKEKENGVMELMDYSFLNESLA